MKTEGIMSSVQNGQVVKKARSARTNAPNDFDFMSVMNTVSLNDISTGTGGSDNSTSKAVNTKAVNTQKTDNSSTERREVSVFSYSKSTYYSKSIDTEKKTTATNTDGQKKTSNDAKGKEAPDSSTVVTNKNVQTEKAAERSSSVKADDRDTKAEDKNTKAAGPETEDDEVERPEAVNDLISDILNTISKDLGVSVDDITDTMETLGLSFADLSIPSNTAELYTALTGSDSGSLLTSDDFVSLMSDLSDIFSGVDDDLMSQLTPVTDEEADSLSDMLSQPQTTGDLKQDGATVINVTIDDATEPENSAESENTVYSTDTTKVSVETINTSEVTEAAETTETAENTASVVSASTETVSDSDLTQSTQQDEPVNSIQTTDTSSGQTLNGTITTANQQSAASENNESGSDLSEMFGKNGRQESQAEQVNVNVVSSGNTQAAGETEVTDFISTIQKYTDINTDDLISQIVDKAKQTLSSKVSSLEMELHPQSLGKIFLQVTEKSGDVTAHLYAQNEAVKHALENRLADLTEDLNRQGVRVNEVTVSVEPHAFDENLQKNMSGQFGNTPNGQTQNGSFEGDSSSGSGRGRSTIDLRNGSASDDMTSDEALEASIMQDNGNTVSYRI